MTKRFPVLLTSAFIALALPFIGCGSGGGESSVAATGVTVNPATLALQVDKTRQLSAAVQPNNATNKGVADVSSSGLVTAKAVGEARITATTQDGGKTASCDVSVTPYDPVEEAKRQAEFERLSGEPNVNRTVYEVKTMDDFNNLPKQNPAFFGYNDIVHTVYGFDYAVSPAVTDPQLREELQKEVDRRNLGTTYTWEHEFKHARDAKYVTIRGPISEWKIAFLDETTAQLASALLFRKNMLDGYAKQLEQFVQTGGNPQQFKFDAWSYQESTNLGTNPAESRMITWYNANNKFAEMISEVSQDEATELMVCYFDYFSGIFDNYTDMYRDPINNLFGRTDYIKTSFDTDEFFQKALNTLFTYKIGDKDVNLLEIMGQAAREEFLAKLNAKMEEEYARWLAGQ